MPLPAGFRRLFRLPWRDVDREIADELEFHLAMKAHDLEAQGYSARQAGEEAARRFGDLAHIRSECRAAQQAVAVRQRRLELLEGLRQDLTVGVRAMRRAPAFTAVAVITLSVGIGANTAIFSVLNSVLLRPLPYPEPDRLVQVVEWNPERAEQLGRATADFNVSAHNYQDYRERNTVFTAMGWVAPLYDVGTVNLTGGSRPERVRGNMASASLFAVLGVRPALGTVWPEEQDAFVFQGPRVALISDGLWRRRFGADPEVVGQTIGVDDWPHTIVGVMPPDFRLPPLLLRGQLNDPLYRTGDLYVPLGYNAYGLARRARQFTAVARLRPGIEAEVAQQELSALAANLAEAYAAENAGWSARVLPLNRLLADSLGKELTLLMAAVGLVLLIACANVANLLLARGVTRSGEIAVRAALGGGRGRLVRQLFTEALLLGAAGAAGGVLLAYVSNGFLVRLIPAGVPRGELTTVDGPVLLFALAAGLATTLIFGLLPALRASRADLTETMKRAPGRKAGAGRGGATLSRGLVAAEVALALVLLVGGTLFTRSFLRLASEDPGYDPENVLKVSLNLGTPNMYNELYACDLNHPRPLLWQKCRRDDEGMRQFYLRVRDRVEQVPGVASAALINAAPLTAEYSGWYPLRLPQEPDPAAGGGGSGGAGSLDDQGKVVGRTDGRLVYPGYFQTMRIRLLAGRDFREDDPRGWSGVAVINQNLALKVWPAESPLGKRISFYGGAWMTVIGVVENSLDSDLRARAQDDGTRASQVYHLGHFPYMDLVVRTRGDPLRLVEPVENAVLELDPNLPVGAVTTLEQMARESNAVPRFYALTVGIFAGVALLIAAVGLYGVVSFSVSRRTQEIGLRKALGATGEHVAMMVAGQAMRAVALGAVIGTAGAVAVTRLIRSFLYGMDPADPVTFGAVAGLLVTVALAASWLPARRASRLDPMEALRYE
ncbi:MAG TPA: ABC transporter permease [Gemmatimonadales bacterium]|nr:ABC transporter permease [Gemmatimonadales bacterium]